MIDTVLDRLDRIERRDIMQRPGLRIEESKFTNSIHHVFDDKVMYTVTKSISYKGRHFCSCKSYDCEHVLFAEEYLNEKAQELREDAQFQEQYEEYLERTK